jgi:predicted signal transduction protein with EAL and GGDEF domain
MTMTGQAMFRRLGRILFDADGTAELSLARWHVLRRQVPVMYALLVTNTIILGATHYHVAPDILD